MTKRYAALKLLEHGPLTISEFLEITGWSMRSAWSVMEWMLENELVEAKGKKQKRYYKLV